MVYVVVHAHLGTVNKAAPPQRGILVGRILLQLYSFTWMKGRGVEKKKLNLFLHQMCHRHRQVFRREQTKLIKWNSV